MIPTYSDLVTDLAAYLAGQQVGVWSADGIYPAGTVMPIYVGILPDEAATGIGLQVYSDDRARDDGTPDIRVQVRIRGDADPRPTGIGPATADRIFILLHDRSNFTLDNATRVLLSRRHLRAPEERDETGRWTRADSYTFTLNPGGS